MKTPFNQSSYLAQVRRLRTLAVIALKKYSLKVESIHFIHHGENATVRIVTRNRQKFLLRIHRGGYHSEGGILEELRWLAILSKNKSMSVPSPVSSKDGNLVEFVSSVDIPEGRHCCIFRWIDGTFIYKSLNASHMYVLGQLIASLQANAPKAGVQHRKYWTANGLVGQTPKFGSIRSLGGVSPKNQRIISEARNIVFKELRAFEKKYPLRQGMIHADLHFGNILSLGEGLGAIDFDDCGLGFHAYDLVIPLISAEHILTHKRKNELANFKDALLSGYANRANWDEHDERLFPHLIIARKLAMLGWLNSRSENPRLKRHFSGAIQRAVKSLKTAYGL